MPSLLGFLTNDVFTNEPLESSGEELSAQPAVVRADEKDLTLHLVTLLQRLPMSNDRVSQHALPTHAATGVL